MAPYDPYEPPMPIHVDTTLPPLSNVSSAKSPSFVALTEAHSGHSPPRLCACCHMNMKPELGQKCHSPLDSCCGNFCPDISRVDGKSPSEYRNDNEEGDFRTPLTYHRRHSLLSRQEMPGGKLVPSVTSPDPMPRLSRQEKHELRKTEASQQEDDDIRMMMGREDGDPKSLSK